MLAAIVNVSRTAADNFKLNLFDDEALIDVEEPAQQHAGGMSRRKEQQLEFGSAGKNGGYIKAVGDVLEQLGLDEQQAGKSIGEDLLDLMDSVS